MNGGHTVLAVPVRALEEVVRERTAFYDASFLSAGTPGTRLPSRPLGN